MLLLLCSISPSLAQDEPTADQEAAWQAFKATHGENWEIRWNEQTGVPEAITQGLSRPFHGSPLQAATAFLSENASLFRMKRDLINLKHVKTLEDEGIHHVTFQQTHQGLPVEDAVYLVHVHTDGRVDMANGTYYPKIEASSRASLGEKQALATALKDASPAAKLEESRVELVIFPVEGGFRTAWKVAFKMSAPAGTWRYFIDAENGQILDKQNLITPVFSPSELMSLGEKRSKHDHEAHPYKAQETSFPLDAFSSSATGSGRVYKKHPDLSSSTYESLPRLKDPIDGIVWTLNGSYAAVRNEAGDEARSSNGNFYYQPTDPHFAEVNLYYHVDRFRYDFWRPLGMNRFDHIKAHANAPYRSDLGPNAWYDPELFGVGEIYFNPDLPAHGTKDFAKEDKIIYHEYSHAVIDMINSDIDSDVGGEEGAINEGTPDYFAGSYTVRTKILEYVFGYSRRDMADPVYETYSAFSNAQPNSHRGGEFWSAVLWDLRNASGMGASVTNRLVYGALYRLDSSPTFLEYRTAIEAEDQTRYGSSHLCTIRNVFSARGIGSVCAPPPVPTNLTVTNDGSSGQNPRLTWNASSGATRYDVYRCLDNPLSSSDCLGTSSFTKIGTSGGLTSYTDYGIQMASACASGGTYYKAARYFVKAISAMGESGASGQDATCSNQAANKQDLAELAAGTQEILPSEYALEAAYPNPFNPTTEIRFALPEAADVRLVVYDALGREVARLVDGPVSAGYQHATFEASNLPSGVYLYRLEAQGSAEIFSKTGRMVLVK